MIAIPSSLPDFSAFIRSKKGYQRPSERLSKGLPQTV
jgi:hypothetical protein